MRLIGQGFENNAHTCRYNRSGGPVVQCALLHISASPMAVQPQSPARLAFGPFEVDAAGGELRKGGVRVRLSGQPFQILLVLLAHPGELVTREQFREQVWSEGTFVDFEHGLNTAINKLRRAPGEAA